MSDTIFSDYELLDSGEGRKLERFADCIVDRPAPQAVWPKNKKNPAWRSPNAFYERDSQQKPHWLGKSVFPVDWKIRLDDLCLQLKPSPNGQVGIFPEQFTNWMWMKECLQAANRPVQVLNGFAYTGAASLVASSAATDVGVCHVDAAKASVTWAKHNANLSGLSKNPIRWIADDVIRFLEREVRRGKKYDAFILDPPAFGRSSVGEWKLERDLPKLLSLVRKLISDNPCFLILSCHAEDFSANLLLELLGDYKSFKPHSIEAVDLVIPAKNGNALPSGTCARIRF